jgi:hypothetical protein
VTPFTDPELKEKQCPGCRDFLTFVLYVGAVKVARKRLATAVAAGLVGSVALVVPPAPLAAEAVAQMLETGDVRALATARKRFMKEHGRVFWILGIMQKFWYSSDRRRERFVDICRDKDVQTLTFESYMNKKLVRKKPIAHVRIFFKDVAHLLGLARV